MLHVRPQGNDLTKALVDKHRMHARLGVETNKWGVPDVASMGALLASKPEISADSAPELLGMNPWEEAEWRMALTDSRALFAAPGPTLLVATDAGADEERRRCSAAAEASSSSSSATGGAGKERESLRALIRAGVRSGSLPTFAAGVTETGRRYLATVLMQSWDGEAEAAEAAADAEGLPPGCAGVA